METKKIMLSQKDAVPAPDMPSAMEQMLKKAGRAADKAGDALDRLERLAARAFGESEMRPVALDGPQAPGMLGAVDARLDVLDATLEGILKACDQLDRIA